MLDELLTVTFVATAYPQHRHNGSATKSESVQPHYIPGFTAGRCNVRHVVYVNQQLSYTDAPTGEGPL